MINFVSKGLEILQNQSDRCKYDEITRKNEFKNQNLDHQIRWII